MSEIQVTQLGRVVGGFDSPEAAVIERVPNPQRGQTFLARFTAPEFTSVCPVTGQPDFATLVIDYVPGVAVVPLVTHIDCVGAADLETKRQAVQQALTQWQDGCVWHSLG